MLIELARVGGIVLLLGGAFAAIMGYASGRNALMGLAMVAALIGLALAVAGDKALDRRKARDKAEAEAAPHFTGSEFTVRPRWFRLGMTTTLVGGLFLGCASVAWSLAQAGKSAAWPVALGALLFGWFAYGWLRLMGQIAAAGYLIHMDGRGFSHAALPLIAWKHVHGIDVEAVEVKGRVNHVLKLALRREATEAFRPPAWRRWLDIAGPKFNVDKQVVGIGLAGIDRRPGEIVGSARSIAARANAPLIPDWRHGEDVVIGLRRQEAAVRAEEAQLRVDALMRRARAMDPAAPNAPESLAQLDAQMKESIDAWGNATSEQIRARTDNLSRRLSELRRGMRVFYVVLAIGAVLFAVRTYFKMQG